MATTAKTGKNTFFQREDSAGSGTYTTVPEVTGTIELGEESPEIDVTNMDSTAVERIADLPDGTMMNFTMNLKQGNATQLALINDVKAGANYNYRVTNANFSVTYSFVLAPLSWKVVFAPKGSAAQLQFSGRVSGSITIT